MIKTYLFTKEGTREDVSLDDWQWQVEDKCALLWVDVRSLNRDDLDRLATAFGLHDLAVESCLDSYRRPHLYQFRDHFYVNFTTVDRKPGEQDVTPSELHLFVGGKFVITAAREAESSAIDRALEEYRDAPELSCRGPMYAVYLLAEDLVETYFPVIEHLDDDADTLEDQLLESAGPESLRRIFALKRRVFELRRLLGPQRDIFNDLARRDFPFIEGESLVFFQDTYNRMVRIFDMLDTVREILTGSLDIYLSTVSNKLNEVVKVLTVAAIILMTLSFITGFYGMNFTHLPWLRSPNAFRNALALMVGITGAMLWWFRRKGWL